MCVLWTLLLAVVAVAADWDRFRGPNGSGVAQAVGLPVEFGPLKNLVWKTELRPGHSSPVLSKDRIFVTAVDGEKLYTISLERATGKILWRREAPRARKESLHPFNNPASSTPAADGKNVYVFFGDYGLIGYGWDGRELWRTPLGPFHNVYGMGVSPMEVDDKVVLVADQSHDSYIAAFGKNDGRLRWKSMRPDAVSGSSVPVVYRPAGGPAQIIAPSSLRMDAYNARTGEAIWYVTGLPAEMKSQPVLDGGRVLINGYNSPENEAGRIHPVAPFEETLAKHDADRDGFISKHEAPDQRTGTYWQFLDLNADGRMDSSEWRKYQQMMLAENALLAFKLGGTGDVTASNFLWKYQRSIPQLPSVAAYHGVLYMINDGGVLTTLDPATGAVFKQARLRGVSDRYFASIVAADDKVYIASHSGVVAVLKKGGGQELLAANDLGEEIFATPAIGENSLFVRTASGLYCFGNKN
ncbi:MAG: PQQ-binding-like beta-propeller repeat protein [Acidobacteria bacterium]|nr:PQQ-binding-like beta-propeller repeat protein [Acidobacteriota bacterium]